MIVIESGHRLITVLPKHPPGDVTEQLASGSHCAGVLRIPNEQRRVRRQPTIRLNAPGPVEVEVDAQLRSEQIAQPRARAQGQYDRRNRSSGKLVHGRDPYFDLLDGRGLGFFWSATGYQPQI